MPFLRRKSEHQWVDESLSAYIDGELSPAEVERVEKHLEECSPCSESLTTLRHTIALVKELPLVSAPRSFAVRPALVKARPSLAPPAWGYGLLKGATALAALLLVLIVGSDLALHFVGITSLTSWAPAAPAPEVAMAPTYEPSIAPAPAEEEPMFGQTKDAEELQAPEAENAQEVAPAAPAPTEAAEYMAAPEETAAAAREEGAEPAGTPTALSTPPAPAPPGEDDVGAGGAETPTAKPVPPASTETIGDEGQPTAETAAPSATPPGEEEHRAAVSEATATPQVLAMVDAQERDAEEPALPERGVEVLPLSPLRLAELIALAVLLLLLAATLLTAWLRRRAG